MRSKFKRSEVIIYTVLLLFLNSTIGEFFWGLFGISISGLDYLSFALFVIIVFILKKSYRLYIDKTYLSLFAIYALINAANIFITDYLTSYFFYLIGFVISIVPFVTFILLSNVSIKYVALKKLIKYIYISIAVILTISIIDSFVTQNSSNNIYWTRFLKTSAFIGTLSVINVVLSLYLYQVEKKSKYIYGILFFTFIVLTSAILKSLLALAFVILIFMYIFYSKKKLVLTGLTFIIVLVFSVNSIESVKNKILSYTNMYLLSKHNESVPRNMLYITSFNIAMDNFPFGSGQGTFGSYPVNYSYSDVYRSYNLSNVHGLSKDSALRRNNKPNYLLDTYWSSILGENGFIGGIIYFILYFFPVILIKKKAGTHSKHNQVLFYLVFAITGLLFIESLVLSMLSQMTFILLYAGVPGLIYNQLKSNYL